MSDEGDATTGVSQSALGDPSLEGAYLSISAGCFTNHTYGGCSQVTCCVYVCRNDPFCCVVEWDDSCVTRAQDLSTQEGPGGPNDTPCTPQTLPGGCDPGEVPTGAFPNCTASTTPNMSAGVEKTVTGADTNKLRGFQTYIKAEAILGPFDTLPAGVTYPVVLPTSNSDTIPDPRRIDPASNLGTLAMLNSTFRGGGLDIAFLGFGEMDELGCVNVSRLGGLAVGPGGFIDIAQNARKVVFCGTFAAKGVELATGDGRLRVLRQGGVRKLVRRVDQITFSGPQAQARGQVALYLTERASFRLTPGGLELFEIAPGVDLERDVLAQMDFRPVLADRVAVMPASHFTAEDDGFGSLARRA